MALHNQHKAIGNLGAGADGVKASMACNSAGGSGRGMTLTPVTGLGARMVSDLPRVMMTYREQVAADRRAAAFERRARRARGAADERLACNY
jgi:hypothetical protein